ncbi:25S rRNA (uridine(2843)-N(3))-methyltransferase [Cladobotryum mycophilum]|uniref:25S rRNA (Uridine(2843)-N(3))-methyltransferase n=1 Tax=Cladobotryum mycophilum TaxID=491253 RepID=A0ABR0S5X8_9HYPO
MAKKHHPNKSSSKSSNSQQSKAKPQPEDAVIATQDTTTTTVSPEDLKDQQRLLNLFSDAFADVLASNEFYPLLQEIKQALFNRDFDAAFGREDYLQTYAARWSPTRALCYASVLESIGGYVDDMSAPGGDDDAEPKDEGDDEEETEADESTRTATQDNDQISTPNPGKKIKMLSIGGCAAEHVAFASHLHATNASGSLTLLDSAPWYASAAVRAANTSLLDEARIAVTFSQTDILTLDGDTLAQAVGTEPLLVTLLFTLNELYTNGGIGKTTNFLKSLGEALPHGSLLLVVDSPGSYSEAAVGKEKKKYPMQWLLDHTLLETKAADRGYKWDKLESQESIWFRLPEGLSYPIQLENMRYQMHLYRIEKNTS